MQKYEERQFDLPELQGISKKQLEAHLGLYSGYVKHVNLIDEKISELEMDETKNSYIISELRRRLGFEWDGMRLHEIYFCSLENGPSPFSGESSLGQKLIKQYGSFDKWQDQCKKICLTRGIGWAILYYDKTNDNFLMRWVDEHSIGHLAGLSIVLVVDVWEHAYMVDYLPSDKKKYVGNYLKNINWNIVSKNFESLV
ncbi:MAG: Fe-Mn family superoxide dismutase [Patescibacteria group bacterium]